MQKNIDDFIYMLRIERQLSKNTLISYRRDIEGFKFYTDKNALNCWTEISEKHVQSYIASRFRSGITGRSLQRALSAIRMFYEYLMRQRKAVTNPAKRIRAPKSVSKLPSYLDVDMSEQLLNRECDTSLNARDKAMFELFYSFGLRLTELVSIDLSDLDIAESEIRVTGKGNKVRVVAVGKQAIIALSEWLNFRIDFVKEQTQALFLNRQGRRISQRSVQLRLKLWAKAQEIEINVHPHMLRDSFANHMPEGNGNIRDVQELLGYEDISSTQIYTHIDFQHLTSVYDQAHPRARKNKA
ncbi:Site-specific tyrosine recombinase XerC [hydrothermal vent metagenome]|uniref:Site-specific tyrosine recombinase XerC n=1 Tax=hydrothermal vent metagenome TaxID=652676 RepID=A0A3B1A5F9_9ZZZZ